jgi:hypothetical protein
VADFEHIGGIAERVLRRVAEVALDPGDDEVYDASRIYANALPAPSIVAACRALIGQEALLRLVNRLGFEGRLPDYSEGDRLLQLVRYMARPEAE